MTCIHGDNGRPHRAWAVVEFLPHETIETLSACCPVFNPIEHLGNIVGRKIHQRNPPIQTVAEREAALPQEWALVPQETTQRLIRSMRHPCVINNLLSIPYPEFMPSKRMFCLILNNNVNIRVEDCLRKFYITNFTKF